MALAVSPSWAKTAPSVPGAEDLRKGASICQHSKIDCPLAAEMAVIFKVWGAANAERGISMDSNVK